MDFLLKGGIKMADKNKSEIFQKIIAQQDIKDILNQSNSTFKNKKGRKKERHGGLTFKFSKKWY